MSTAHTGAPARNNPEREDLLVVEDGQRKLTVEPVMKVKNAAEFFVEKEDHTLGNLLRMELLANKHVLFSAYTVDHPLEHRVRMRVQTDGTISPLAALEDAVKKSRGRYERLRSVIVEELRRWRQDGGDAF